MDFIHYEYICKLKYRTEKKDVYGIIVDQHVFVKIARWTSFNIVRLDEITRIFTLNEKILCCAIKSQKRVHYHISTFDENGKLDCRIFKPLLHFLILCCSCDSCIFSRDRSAFSISVPEQGFYYTRFSVYKNLHYMISF